MGLGTAKIPGTVLEEWNSMGQREPNQVQSSVDSSLVTIGNMHSTPSYCCREIMAKTVPGSMLAAKCDA